MPKKYSFNYEEQLKPCDSHGCQGMGEYRAPKNRHLKADYYWFCLEHVKEYNKQWNYYEGMDEGEIELELRSDTTWRRPTWKLGTPHTPHHLFGIRIEDPLEIFNLKPERQQKPIKQENPDVYYALSILSLTLPLNIEDLKKRYKVLVKKYHPDLNKGCKKMEEKFKQVAKAYAILHKFLAP